MALEARTRTRTARRPPPRFEQFFAIRRFQPTLAFSPDGRRLLYVTDTSGQFNLWRVGVRGGTPEQLTAFENESVRSVAPSPDGKLVAFTADRDGDEYHQLYARPARGGWPEQWTDLSQVQHFLGPRGWSPDGEWLAYSANADRPTDQDVWVRERGSGETRKVFGRDMFAVPTEWSPDGSRLLVSEWRSESDSSVHLVDVEQGEERELTPHDGEVKFIPGPWASNGSGFYLLTDEGREFTGLAFYRLEDGRLELIETPEADIEDVALAGDGSVLVWLVNERGWGRLQARDLASGRLLPAAQLPQGAPDRFGTALSVSPDGSHAALLWSQPHRATELYAVELASGRGRRLTDSMLGGLRERDLVAPEEIVYTSFDGREVPAWLYRARGRGRRPALLSIHGGPEWQERPQYNGLYQYLLSRGIVVLATNIRGSTGYGKSYQKLIHRDWGGGDLEDLRHAAEWLRAQDWVDPNRIAVSGGSYGGFATLSCVTRLPDYWAAAVDIVGPSNLVTCLKAAPPTWRRFLKDWCGDPETEADFLMERSPITYVDACKTPLLVLQGANDPRVVKPESDQMVERLRELGREVEYVVFEDEGHGFTKRHNELRSKRLAADWLERRLTR